MKKTAAEIISDLTNILGNNVTSDDAIALVENINDSVVEDTTDWKRKYEESEETWRKKYVERFTEGVVEKPFNEMVNDLSYDDLFS